MKASNWICVALCTGALVLGGAGNASAITISCPTPDPAVDDGEGPNQDDGDTRFFTLTITSGSATCYAEGGGPSDNLQEKDYANVIDSDIGAQLPGAEGELAYSSGTDAGTFAIAASVWDSWNSVLLGFKAGGGGETPIWAVFLLTGGITGGSFDINDDGADQGMSHAILWGNERGNSPPSAVPEPASLLLMGTGLAAVGARLRHRRRDKKD